MIWCGSGSIIYIIMKKSDEQGVGIIIEGYFRTSERQLQEQEKKLVRISEIYAKQGWQRRLVHQLYSLFKKLLKKDNFPTLCKRLLRIWDQLLENQAKKNISSGYRQALSEIIVESYTFIFPLIFEYRFHELILDFKVYRMLWANYITDESFHQIRAEIGKMYRNFDLNKGFTQENIDKIRKRFAKKGVSEEDIQKYMGITQFERRSDPSPSSERRMEREKDKDSSEEEESDALRKRIKSDVVPQHYARQNYEGYTPEQYMYPGPGNVYLPQQQYQIPTGSGYPPRGNLPQANMPSNFPPPPTTNKSLYPPSSYQRPYGNGGYNVPPPPSMPSQGSHYPMQAGVTPTPVYYPEPKGAQYGGGYKDYNNNYQTNYPSQPTYGASTSNYPQPPPPSQPSSYLTPPISTFPQPPYPPSTSAQRPPKLSPPADFIASSRDLKRQSPEFTPKMGRSPLPQQYYPEIYDSASTAKTDFRSTSPEISHIERSDKGKYKLLLANLRKGLHECKQCGVHFLSRQNLDQHKREHFQEAQRRFQTKQAQQITSSLGVQKQRQKAKENFDMLCNINWVLAGSSSEGEAVYQVSIKRLPPTDRTNPVFSCYFCNEDLEVNWCTQLQEWTLNNGIKVHEADRGLCVAHFDCYQCFRNDEPSFQTAQLAN